MRSELTKLADYYHFSQCMIDLYNEWKTIFILQNGTGTTFQHGTSKPQMI